MKKHLVIILLFVLIGNIALVNSQSKYLVGYGKTDITYTEDELGLFGFGVYTHRIKKGAISSRLYSRVITVKELKSSNLLVFIHLDFGMVSQAIRDKLINKITMYYPYIHYSSIMITASHTHHGPNGFGHYAMYTSNTPGIKPRMINVTVNRIFKSFQHSMKDMEISSLEIKKGRFKNNVPVAYNRAVKAYNKNPEVVRRSKSQSNLAINREMQVLNIVNDATNANRGFINWFGVHPIEMLTDFKEISGASKGYAAYSAEKEMDSDVVAIFAQSAAGDVRTVDGHNSERFDSMMQGVLNEPNFHHKKSSLKLSKFNGSLQANKALKIRKSYNKKNVSGKIDHELIYVDMSSVQVDPEFSFGESGDYARTGPPVTGVAQVFSTFYYDNDKVELAGGSILGYLAQLIQILDYPHLSQEERDYKTALFLSQYPKSIFIDNQNKTILGVPLSKYPASIFSDPFSYFFFNILKDQDVLVEELLRLQDKGALEEHTLITKILPVQVTRIGNLVIAGIPTEITTVAYNRLQKTIKDAFKPLGVTEVIISSYANEYAGYTTTYQEYFEQRYEGGHTLFGRHQLGAFQTIFKKIAKEMLKPKHLRNLDYSVKPPQFSAHELALRSNLSPLPYEEENKMSRENKTEVAVFNEMKLDIKKSKKSISDAFLNQVPLTPVTSRMELKHKNISHILSQDEIGYLKNLPLPIPMSEDLEIDLEEKVTIKLKLFPVPATSELKITGKNKSDISTVRFFNLSGGNVTFKVHLIRSDDCFKIYDISKLRRGIYIVKTDTESHKIIIN